MALLIFGSYVEADADADEGCAGRRGWGADEDAVPKTRVCSARPVPMWSASASGTRMWARPRTGDGVEEADERRLGDADADVDALAD